VLHISATERAATHSGTRASLLTPDFGRHDPTRGQFNEQTRTRGGQDYDQYGQQGQWRQGGQTTSDNTYLGGDRELHQTGYKGQVIGGPQERFEPPVNYGTSTGTGPGARPCNHEIRRDGGFGGKPTIPERVMGELALVSSLLVGMSFDHLFCLQELPKRWSERLPAMLGCTNMVRSARYVNLRVSTSLARAAIVRLEGTKLWPRLY
jgi:hypothetical protein